jgi:dihydroflavonol-4-reductase
MLGAMSGELVLVTGGSGFVGAHCILALLAGGYRVRTTVRDLSRTEHVCDKLRTGGAGEGADAVEFVAADLESDEGWAEAVDGVDYVLHVASPFPAGVPKHEDELIVPAREGALRVLRAAREAGVKRVVLTSSFAAIGYSDERIDRPYTEEDWSDPNGSRTSAYAKSKTLAERAAWQFVTDGSGAGPELAVVNPVAILGPVLGPDPSTSIQLVQRLLDGDVPGAPHLSYGLVDVRDVADLHVRAMTHPDAAGDRFLAVAGDFASMHEIALVLKARLGDRAKRVPTRTLPNWLVRLIGRFDPSIRAIILELGVTKQASNDKAKTVLGWRPRSNDDAILATAESLEKLGLLKKA